MRTWRTVRLLAVVALLAAPLAGCRLYHLPGHHADNVRRSPPDITMRVGERRLAISTVFPQFRKFGLAGLVSQDPAIVEVEMPKHHTAYLRARETGTTRIRYHRLPRYIQHDEQLREDAFAGEAGFTVTVEPRRGP